MLNTDNSQNDEKNSIDFFFQSKHTSYIGGNVHVELGWITQSILSTIYLYTWGLSSCNLPQYCTNWYQTLKCIIKCMPLFLFIFEEKPWAPYYLGGKFLAKNIFHQIHMQNQNVHTLYITDLAFNENNKNYLLVCTRVSSWFVYTWAE